MAFSSDVSHVLQHIVDDNPDISLFSLLNELKKLKIAYEEPPTELLIASLTIKAKDALSALNVTNPTNPSYPQFIQTGTHLVINNLLTEDNYQYLSTFANTYFSAADGAPLCHVLTSKSSDDFKLIIRSICSKFVKSISSHYPFSDFSVIGSRCFLRRTFSLKHSEISGNINNQNWHQDSNPLFGSLPMATIWLPLNEGSGYVCPGLDISRLFVESFHPNIGDGALDLPITQLATSLASNENHFSSIMCDVLDGVVFNGLTFHRTSYSETMSQSRDVFLIRVAPTALLKYFPGNRDYDFTI